jgi:hypothetical protein
MESNYPKKLASYTRAFGQDFSNPCFSEIAYDADDERNFRSKHSDKDIKVLQLPVMTAGAVMLLKILAGHGAPVHKNSLIRHFFGVYDNKIDPHMDALRERKYIRCNEDMVNIMESGKEYIREYDTYGVEEVSKKGFQYAVLKFLYHSNGEVKVDYFPKFLIESCPHITDGYKTLDLMYYLERSEYMKPYVDEKNHFYSLSTAGKKRYEIENRGEIHRTSTSELNMLDLGIQIAEIRNELINDGILRASTQGLDDTIHNAANENKNPPKVERTVAIETHYHGSVTSIMGNNGPVVLESAVSGSQVSGTSSGSNSAMPKRSKPNRTKTILKIISAIVVVAGAISGIIKLILQFMHQQH